MISVCSEPAGFGKNAPVLNAFARRLDATPPGICPIAVQVSFLEAEGLQTCGKCVPCRDGIPQLVDLLKRVLECKAAPGTLDQIRTLAEYVRDMSDCAIGYMAGVYVLEGLDTFADEYASHMDQGKCLPTVGQKVPCEALCPAHVNVPGYIALAAKGDCAGAVKMVRKDNPYPTACALICEHPCESRCRRSIIDAPINIRGIKKYAVDNAHADTVDVPHRLPDTGRRVAIVGGGASGMTCAYFLALMGHSVTVLEARKQLGGMLRYGIPAYRFPRERLEEDNRAILSVGNIDVKCNVNVDAAKMRELTADFDAVYVAIGAQSGKSLNLPGVDSEGVMSAVEMLGAIGDGNYPDFTGQNVAIIGGGNVAMDCARTAVRAGAKQVVVAYRRRIEDMTALPSEVEGAMQEGVEMMTLNSPVRIEADEDGHARRLICQPQYISAVKRGRPAPVPADKPEVAIDADIVLIAVGQGIVSAPFEEFGMKTNRSVFVTDEYLRAEGFENVFVGGDCQTGPKSAILAIGSGKAAARNIDEYLGFHHTLDPEVETPDPQPNDRTAYGRVAIVERPAFERKNDWDPIELEISQQEAVQECRRCLRCDCYGCGSMEGGRIQYV